MRKRTNMKTKRASQEYRYLVCYTHNMGELKRDRERERERERLLSTDIQVKGQKAQEIQANRFTSSFKR